MRPSLNACFQSSLDLKDIGNNVQEYAGFDDLQYLSDGYDDTNPTTESVSDDLLIVSRENESVTVPPVVVLEPLVR
uniref:Polyprotein n=1 Tax=Rhabditophanes sp. KR3021 TaxID=114890 RepID=A0AC35TXG7_9BILA